LRFELIQEDSLKIFTRLILLALLATFLSGTAAVARKPVKAFFSSAKIAVVEGRPEEALMMLDSISNQYGPYADGLNLRASIMVDYVDKTSSPSEQIPYVEKMVANFDSLKMCCVNEDVKKKYRKDCDELIQKADSTLVKYWRQFYNAGITQITVIGELEEEWQADPDPDAKEEHDANVQANVDSCLSNLQMAIIIDPTDHRAFVGLGSLYESKRDHAKAIEWMKKGLEVSEDRGQLLLPIAYNYINMDDYCGSIPYFAEHCRNNPEDLSTAGNLSVCYNNCDMPDSAAALFKTMLEQDPNHVGALAGIGERHRKAASVYRSGISKTEDEAEAKRLQELSDQSFDSAAAYFRRIGEINPDTSLGLESYALISYVRTRYDEAAAAFDRLTKIQPDVVDHWISLGDCHLNLQDWASSAAAYEKVVELQPDNKTIWERLSGLYVELKDNAGKAKAEEQVKRLSN
jgi:tetratricopeptide (TPR) repeat protein